MPKIIIVCGAGGKTSYINKLSKKYKDKNVVITTTAKIFKPDKYIETIDSYSFDNDNIIVLGKEYDEKKLMYAKDDELIKAINFADVIIIEADSIYDEIINKEFENKDYYAFYNYNEGINSSIKLGLNEALNLNADPFAFFVCDMIF